MNAPVSIYVKDILVAETDLKLTFPINIAIGFEPTAPDNVVTLYDTPGSPPAETFGGGSYYYDSIQVRVRNNDYLEASTLAWKIRDILTPITNHTVADGVLTRIKNTQPPFHLGRTPENRHIFIINFEIQRR